MSTIVDMLYREFCRARLAEMRKQLLIPVVGEILQPPLLQGDDAPDPHDRGLTAEESPTIA